MCWKEALNLRIRSVAELLEFVELDSTTLPYSLDLHNDFPCLVTREFATRIKKGDPFDPLLLQILPQQRENNRVAHLSHDPLQEKKYNKIPGLIHKYKSRVLLTLTSACAINCRYCFRRHFAYQDNIIGQQALARIVEYLQDDSKINEVILSGGDPLLISDKHFAKIYQKLQEVAHLKYLRIHSRLPIVLPQRINLDFIRVLNSGRLKTTVVTHCNHANELVKEVKQAALLLLENKIQVLNQSVLLQGVNDNAVDLIELNYKLYDNGILPYYLHYPDQVAGTEHFIPPKNRARILLQALQENLPGYLVPRLVCEQPGKLHKTYL